MKKRPLAERFWEKVDKTSSQAGCWLWTGAKNHHGYGRVAIYQEQPRAAHRVSWFLAHGVWPELSVCHSCDTPACVNPAHLWLGTHSDNMADAGEKGRSIAAIRKAQTHCKHGHELTEANTRATNRGRACRACDNNRATVRRRANPDAHNAYMRVWRATSARHPQSPGGVEIVDCEDRELRACRRQLRARA